MTGRDELARNLRTGIVVGIVLGVGVAAGRIVEAVASSRRSPLALATFAESMSDVVAAATGPTPAEVLRATANDLGDWLGSSDLMADEISDHGIDVILRWLRERAGQVEREGGRS